MKVRMEPDGGSRLLVVVAVVASLVAFAALLTPSADPRPSAAPTATVALVTTSDFRVAVAARRLTAGSAPTAEVRVGLARRFGASWREFGERRLDETYFWRTLSGPRAICRLAIATAGRRPAVRPYVTLQLLLSPSLGCGRTHRIPLAT
jgi:hypothetical protein